MQDGCADPLDVWQEVNVEWKLRLKLCCIDVLAVEAIGHPLRQLHHSHRLVGEGAGVVDHKVAATGALVVHEEHQVPIILTCAAPLDIRPGLRSASTCRVSRSRAGPHLTRQVHFRRQTVASRPCAESLTHLAPLCWSLNALHPCIASLLDPAASMRQGARCMGS